MVQTRSNANVGTGAPHQGENSATGGRHPPITTGEAEALIQRVGITAEQFKEVLAALTPNREIVVEDVVGGPAGGKAGPAGSQGKKKKVRRSQKKKGTKPNGKAVMEDALSRLDEESSSFKRMSTFDRLGDPKSKKPRTSAFEQLRDTQSARKGDLRDTLKEKRGESTATSKTGFEERRTTVEDKGAAELWRMYEQLEKRMDAQNPYRQAVFNEVTPFSRRIMSCPLPNNFKTPQIKAYNGTTDPQDHLARFGANVVMYAYPEEIKCRCFLATLEGQAWLEDLECVISPVHLCLKFNTPTGVGVAKGNQSLSRSCYVRATKSQARVDENVSTICAAIQKEEGRPRAEPAEEVEEVSLDPTKPERKVKVGRTLPLRLKGQLWEVLQVFKVLFAWGPEDMPGVDPKIICHRLAVDPAYRPVKQKKRFLSSERREFVTKQVTTLQSIGHIREVRYPDWLANVEFKPRPAIKGQALADFVVGCTAREVESSGEEPEGSWWTVYTDGSSATDASGGGVVAISPEGFKAYYSVRFRFKVSNNEAEYEALLCGLRLAASLKAERIQVRCDSKLIVGHVTGEFEAKDERMKKYRDTALELLKAFGAYRIEQVPREENAEADILSKLGPDSPDHIKAMTQEEELLEPSISLGQVLVITLKEPADWIDEITMYLLDGSPPTDPITAKVVKRRAPSYTLECGRLYKRSAVQAVVQWKVTLQGYFWPTIIRDCAEYVRRCKVCQEFQRMPGRPATNYTPISTAIPFARWGIDLVGILPWGTWNNTYLVVAIDYFTKWVEAAPVPTITEEQMRKFVSKQILCRFGVPQQIITDNGTQFEARGFNEFLQSWGIKHSYAAIGTTPRKATGETPFSLTYGFEARAPAETSLLSHRVETFDAQENEENLRAELHLIDERRERAYIRAENYRRQVKSYHDQRVRPRQFKVGDWVLRKREVSRPTDGGKFAKSFEGPYVIKKVLADGTFRLQTPSGGDIPRVWNAANLIKFYQ
ncbi:unnamed protein product [Cuscuta campestris]|uniref:Uncharacterized protein n=1 Tax=Cuscuta campestris TaxID=132261 RepID=A0A484KRL1_9ASTE|nr:unnamed protein product [Cuscuta campestris]